MATVSASTSSDGVQGEPSTVYEAEEILSGISGILGEVPVAIKDQLNARPSPIQAYLDDLKTHARKNAEKLVKITTQSVYTGKSRYLYELIQNADDANYSVARRSGHDPFLTFTLTSQYLYVDTNEDGFNVNNVKAICSVSESTKKISLDDGSIGEKGIGFKSVYNIAQSVHVQSGVWSFQFDKNWDDPLSLFIPKHVKHLQLPQGVNTRIAIRYEHGYSERVARALGDLTNDTVAFLRKLMRVNIHFEGIQPPAGTPSSQKFRKHLINPTENGHLMKLSASGADLFPRQKTYRVYRQEFTDMPKDDRRLRTIAEVQLAFPVNPAGNRPSLSLGGECLFAFLPMFRDQQLPFIVQSDFITNTSRESIVSCDWNDKLLEHVAQAFMAAVHDFIKLGAEFSYNWLDFLPPKSLSEPLLPMSTRIYENLQSQPILHAWAESNRAAPSRLVILPHYFIHDQAPLFKDIERPSVYLAPRYYHGRTTTKLSDLGVGRLGWKDAMSRFATDAKSLDSMLQTTSLDNAWHDTFAMFIREALSEGRRKKWIEKELWDLPILALADGTWASPSDTVYFPQVDNHAIPSKLGLRLVNPDAIRTGERKRLYVSLGVSECDPQLVGDQIILFHSRESGALHSKSPQIDIIPQLRFLHRFVRDIPDQTRPNLLARTSNDTLVRAKSGLFFPSDHKYHAQQLLKTIHLKGLSHESAEQGTRVLHSDFLAPEHTAAFYHGLKWEEWLARIMSVEWYPPLIEHFESATLSPIMSKVMQADSRIFLGTLQAHWTDSYALEAHHAGNKFIDHLSEQSVLCINGESHPLDDTFAPQEQLLNTAKDLGIFHQMHFLQLPQLSLVEDDWHFLRKFGVRFDADLHYWLEAIRSLGEADDLLPKRKQRSAWRIYKELGCMASQKDQKIISNIFVRGRHICNPKDSSDWRFPDECRWDGPDFKNKYILLERSFGRTSAIKHLFTTILAIQDVVKEDVVDELQSIKDDSAWQNPGEDGRYAVAMQRMTAAYMAAKGFGWAGKESKIWLSERFEALELVFVNGTWYKPRNCVWDSTFEDPDRPKIRPCYPELQSFFVNVISVPTVDILWLIQELQNEASSPNPSFSRIKMLLSQLGTMYASRESDNGLSPSDSLTEMEDFVKKDLRYLPIRQEDGVTSLFGSGDSFAVNDHDRYAMKFAGHVNVLDFDLEETRKLHTLLIKLRLGHRYLSRLVERFSEPTSSEFDEQRSEDLRKRAYALACCAAKYKSQRYIGEPGNHYRLLRAKVHLSDDLRSQIRLYLPSGGTVVKSDDQVVPTMTGIDNGDITIYLPKAERDIERAYRASLPNMVQKLLGIQDGDARNWLYLLLTEKLGRVSRVLEDAEAPSLAWLDPIDLSGEDDKSTTQGSDCGDEQIMVTSDAGEDQAPRQSSIWRNDDCPLQSSHSVPLLRYSPIPTTVLPHRPRPSLPTVQPILQTELSSPEAVHPSADEYLRLLENVVLAARQGLLHSERNKTMPAFNRTLVFGDRHEAGNEYYSKIGAVGELFVYETLKKLRLPEFGLANWPSRIRRLVRPHPDYADMEPFPGPDMDIVVEDDSIELERWLRHKSCGWYPQLPRNEDGSRKRIKFEFEVKSTTGLRSDKMFMSQSQYARMQKHRLDGDQWSGTIFVLVRVFNLLDSRPELTLYVDPARFEGGALTFTPGKWEVEAKELGN